MKRLVIASGAVVAVAALWAGSRALPSPGAPVAGSTGADTVELVETTAVTEETDGVVTPVLPAAPFHEAEAYHQNFCRTHPLRTQRPSAIARPRESTRADVNRTM